ncbi:MAG: hypothetical protein L0K47_08215 [Acidipropionibacterium jensenii]|nr:hypothetical protein [Acidipropionibacterium jensenii]MDN5977097.1 hypothetical protein [Acidipropionibacterium jensenii]MDN5995940.1 hypothetical protein [Acidipropionibacterium jensenii]MDN6426188.1 hypothetical protein [Acidipropionibacterium jensenii]MDN6440966.1 hypothetical protein [Acidipropionibacterium jensenii]MDN6480183.1 hypothetical protein [Acidipropionibacterium jensenii]
MPISNPLIMVPTAAPRRPGEASSEAKGTSTWAATEKTEAAPVPISMTGKVVEEAATSCPAADSRIRPAASFRRSTMSPSGTKSTRPIA